MSPQVNVFRNLAFAFALSPAVGQAATTPSLFAPIPAQATAPKANPTTPAKVELGKQLFFDPRLSVTGSVSCNSCHNLMGGGDDNMSTSFGIRGLQGKRSAPTVWNSGQLSVMFWDGRAESLEAQAIGPMTNSVEMGMQSHDLVISRLRDIPGYQVAFQKAFGKGQVVNIDNAAKAIAAFERTLNTPDSAFDKYLRGNKKALSKEAQEGFELVQSVGCTSCHQGVNFAGPTLPTGTGFFQKFPTIPGSDYETKYKLTEDLGRYEATKKEEDKGFWRVPTWRNVALTAPYFHNGSVATLDEAVRVMGKTQLGKDLNDGEVKKIVAFLDSLTGQFPKIVQPRLPETLNRSLLTPVPSASH